MAGLRDPEQKVDIVDLSKDDQLNSHRGFRSKENNIEAQIRKLSSSDVIIEQSREQKLE